MKTTPILGRPHLPTIVQIRSWLSRRAAPRSWKLRRYHWVIIGVLVLTGFFSYLTNPFVRFSIVHDPFADTMLENGQFILGTEEDQLWLRNNAVVNRLAMVKSGWHILTGKLSRDKKAHAQSVEQIIADIHTLRFNPAEPFLISGDHFSVFYPRSLGIFYHTLMDPRTKLSEKDWLDRQELYLKSTAYALRVFSQSDRLSTTIVPIGPESVALMNIYAPPSDTLYSLLFALQAMQSPNEMLERYPYGELTTASPAAQLQTSEAATILISKYGANLAKHWQEFHDAVYDDKTGLVRKDIALSGVKDMSKRESAFYDNVMYWKTAQLAQQLGIIDQDEVFLVNLKQRILQTFWDATEGHFLEDLSDDGLTNKNYSSEWIIAYQTGMLEPTNPDDVPYLIKSVDYIQNNALDQPFGLQYHADERPQQLYGVVRYLARDYGSTAIWSNLGQEYSKLLIALFQVTKEPSYLQKAGTQLDAYAYNIKRYRGYPEVYDSRGDFYRQGVYKSVLQTGWVVSFEQARAMYRATLADIRSTAPLAPSPKAESR